MTFVYIDKDGNELISNGCDGVPIVKWMDIENEYITVLPKGTIKKLIGYGGIYEMNKNNEPFELKEDKVVGSVTYGSDGSITMSGQDVDEKYINMTVDFFKK